MSLQTLSNMAGVADIHARTNRIGGVRDDPRPTRHFVVVRTRDTAAADREINFSVQGFSESTHPASALQSGDLIAVYVGKPVKGFVAVVEITSDRFTSTDRIWTRPDDRDERFELRYHSRPRVVVPDDRALKFVEIQDDLDYARNLVNPRLWGMLFIRAIRDLTPHDLRLIEERLRERAA